MNDLACAMKPMKLVISRRTCILAFSIFAYLLTVLCGNFGGVEASEAREYSLTADSYDYHRHSPPSPVRGTRNWELLSPGPSMFSPRHSHATCVFKCPTNSSRDCIWLTGGRSETYRTFNLKYEDRNADVWWTEDGATWNKGMHIEGDFLDGIGNFDAKIGGQVAPWYSRYGHSLNALDADGDGIADAMVLAGGFEPIPSNDVWITTNGTTWKFDGYAPWSARAYHAATVFRGRLWIMGGSPLTNDVWAGRLMKDPSKAVGYRMEWKMKAPHMNAPWAPRAGMCIVTQLRRESYALEDENATFSEYMYMIGGFAGWPKEDTRHDGNRARNDVWVTSNGTTWERVLPPKGMTTMPFAARAWHGCTTWHDAIDRSLGVSTAAMESGHMHPRMYIAGGGYIGTKGNNVVRSLEGFVDLWWSDDGSDWNKVNYDEGVESSLYSTNEWSLVIGDNRPKHLGKWGHTLESLPREEDLNKDGEISNAPWVSIEFCGGAQTNVEACNVVNVTEAKVPSLFVIGGDTVDGGPMVHDVFASRPGINCELNGITCSGRGTCGPGVLGCVCDAIFEGEYCERYNESYDSAGPRARTATSLLLIVVFMTFYLG